MVPNETEMLPALGAAAGEDRYAKPHMASEGVPNSRGYCDYDESRASWAIQATGAVTSPWTGKGIRVAVLDTGAALAHPHLAPRIQGAESFVRGETAEDGNGHGTTCCGIVCGPRVGGVGYVGYGVAPSADLYVGKVLLDANRAGDLEGVIRGIEWALAHECRVICLALGDCYLSCKSYPRFEELARHALDQGTLIIAAAGNTSNRFGGVVDPVLYPASCEWVLAVSSVTGRLTIDLNSNAGGTNRGSAISVAAPGQAILSAARNDRLGYSNGTSMAAAFTAGLAALWIEAHPQLGGRQLWDVIESTAQALPKESRVDVGAGLARAPQLWDGFKGEEG